MQLSKEREFELLITSIEEASKHARNLLFVLVVASIYVLISAFSGIVGNNLELPVLATEVSTADFYAMSPVIILGIYLYMHIYISELSKRLVVFDDIDIECHHIPHPRLLLFPWLLTFSEYRAPRLVRNEDKKTKVFPSKNIYTYFVSGVAIWLLGPIVLSALWIRFIGQEQAVSIVPCLCFIVSMFIMTSPYGNAKIIGGMVSFVGIILILTTVASVPEFRSELPLDTFWITIQSNAPIVWSKIKYFIITFAYTLTIGTALVQILFNLLLSRQSEIFNHKLESYWLSASRSQLFGSKITSFIIERVIESNKPYQVVSIVLGICLGVMAVLMKIIFNMN